MYGLINKETLDNYIIEVCRTIGVNNKAAAILLSETALAETNYGDTPDLTPNSDYGIMQFTATGLKYMRSVNSKYKTIIKNKYGVDVDTLTTADLAFSPLKSVICARLYYLAIASSIPSTLEGRAQYWKTYYNSSLGSGTVQGYIKAVQGNERAKIVNWNGV